MIVMTELLQRNCGKRSPGMVAGRREWKCSWRKGYNGKKARICADVSLALFNVDFAAVYLLGFRAAIHQD